MPVPVIVIHDELGARDLAVSASCAAGLQATGFEGVREILCKRDPVEDNPCSCDVDHRL